MKSISGYLPESDKNTLENQTRHEIKRYLDILAYEGYPGLLARNHGGFTPEIAAAIKSEILASLGITLSGRVLDLGVGLGLGIQGYITTSPGIRNYIALELNSSVIREAVPRVLQSLDEKLRSKVVLMNASFNDIPLPPDAVDYVLEEDAFHHSEDLVQTFYESLRVLRPKGYIVAIDRFHDNEIQQEQLQYLLDQQNPPEFWQATGASGCGHTRGELGEHEIRISEWEDAINEAAALLNINHRVFFVKYWILSARLRSVHEVCKSHPWQERVRMHMYDRVLKTANELDAIFAYKALEPNGHPYFVSAKANGSYHTWLTCADKFQDPSRLGWMCRGVICIQKL